ncbi:MAG TPA: hypothetical protein VGZ03_10880 [Acidimicrobiales bacterium]|nr:hypothetical protein [Acidimicrobiales bacterium]
MTRIRIAVLCACALAAASAVATPAFAGSATPTVARVSHGGFGTPAQIPWGSVGSGWVLTQWTSAQGGVTAATYLVLTSVAGQRYIVLQERAPYGHAQLLDWSGDGQRALFHTQTRPGGLSSLLVVRLRTGAVTDSINLSRSQTNDFQSAGFTRPNGFGLVVATYTTHLVLTRYSLSGQSQVTYPYSLASVGKLGGWLYRPDGTELALGAQHGLAIVANDGSASPGLHLNGASSCTPQSWWSATIVLANCLVGPHSESRLFEFPVAGGAPRALTRDNVPPDYGDLSGWRVGGHVYVNVASACGYIYLAKLVGAAPVMMQVPGVPAGHSVHVVGATSSSLAITASLACHGGPSLLWYTPSTSSTRVVLGPPATGGTIEVSVPYPVRLG